MGGKTSSLAVDETSPSDGDDDDDNSSKVLDRDTLLIKGIYPQKDYIKTRSDGIFAYFCKQLNFRVKVMELYREDYSDDEQSESESSDEGEESKLIKGESVLIEMSQVEGDNEILWYEIEDVNLHKYFEAITSAFYLPGPGANLDTDKPSQIMSKQHNLTLKMLTFVNRTKVKSGDPLEKLRDEIISLQKELLKDNTKTNSY